MLIVYPTAMLSPCFANMNEETFKRLPGSRNAFESYNRCSKTEKSDILKVAMMYTYKVDLAAALENLAITQKIATSYTSMTSDEQKQRAQQQSKARQKRYCKDDDNGGPPDNGDT